MFYATPEHPCSYLDGKQAKSIFLTPDQVLDESIYMQLTDVGFRRSGKHIYRPWCDNCVECKSVRVVLNDFKLSKSQKRVLNNNKDLKVSFEPAQITQEIYSLYQRYIDKRHKDGDMYPPSHEQFEDFLCKPPESSHSQFICFRLKEKLLAVAVVDLLPQGISAIYTFFDPDQKARSLGRLAILWQINWGCYHGMEFVYLGYWIKECQKMSYKSEYQPLEVLDNQKWQLQESYSA